MSEHTCYSNTDPNSTPCGRDATRIVNVNYGPDTYYCSECANVVYGDAFRNHYPIVMRVLRTEEDEENET